MAQGIRQFLHLGSGIPTNVHEQAQQQDPATRVVYVDYEAVAVHHSFELLKDNDHAAYRDACPAGSYLAISTMSQDEADGRHPRAARRAAEAVRDGRRAHLPEGQGDHCFVVRGD